MREIENLSLTDLPFREIAILGPGLLGGSLALALRERSHVRIWGRNESAIAEVQRRQIAALATTNLEAVVSGADLIILCTPIEIMAELARKIAPHAGSNAVITDVGSVKKRVLHDVTPIFRQGKNFVGSHPMAGSEKTGLTAARADLFSGAVCVLTPDENSSPEHVSRLAEFWKSLGCTVCEMTAEEHDRRVGSISHLPHLSAAAVLHAAAARDPEAFALAGPGIRDATRIAGGSPEMWSGILLANRENMLADIAELVATLQRSAELLRARDEAGLKMFLTGARTLRESLTEASMHGRD